ncbi:hypothetical protein HAX54_023784, partial [Datura stramonium]|nr:hypothetical protein [Datura stramonium]
FSRVSHCPHAGEAQNVREKRGEPENTGIKPQTAGQPQSCNSELAYKRSPVLELAKHRYTPEAAGLA